MEKKTKVGLIVLGVFAALVAFNLIDGEALTDPTTAQREPETPSSIPEGTLDRLRALYNEAQDFTGPVRCEQKKIGERLYAGCGRAGIGALDRYWLYDDGRFAPLPHRAQEDRDAYMPPEHHLLFDLLLPLPADVDLAQIVDAFDGITPTNSRRIPREDLDELNFLYFEHEIHRDRSTLCDQKRIDGRLYAGCASVFGSAPGVWLYANGRFTPVNGRAMQHRNRFPSRHPKIRDINGPLPRDIVVSEVFDAFSR